MRADRLKQVMQDIDSTFDEKNLGMSKFSRFVQEAAHRGLLSLTKLENGQLEVGPPRPGEAPSETLATHAPAAGPRAAAGAGDERTDVSADRPATDGKPHAERGEERGRRRRGGRGRGRDRESRQAREAGAATVAADGVAPLPITDGEVPAHEVTPAATAAVLPAVPSGSSAIGASGERLTRDEAFDLVRRSVAAAAIGDEAVRASDVRSKAFELLGRDSESLSERNFSRILRDAHDADLIDLRRRGDDYEVAPAVSAAPVALQLNAAAAAHGAAATTQAGAASTRPVMPRGLGVRGSRRGGPHTRSSAPPAELLSVGIVDVGSGTSMSGPEPVVEAEHVMPHAVEPVVHAVGSRAVEDATTADTDLVPAPAPERSSPRAGPRATAAGKRPRSRAKRAAAPAPAESAPRAKRGRTRAASKSTEG